MNKDEIKSHILTETIAQGVLNHLQELQSNRAHMQRRWIWELLQNARDASSKDSHLVASVEVGKGELVFQHTGRGFTDSEVGHLIFHGTTKSEDEGTLGQYGSGFITTHLLSPEINVSGQLQDGSPFDFALKREIGSLRGLVDSMDHAWDEFHAARPSRDPLPDGFTTRFRYSIEQDAMGAVEEGITALRRCAPFVVVFNHEFQRIHIQSSDNSTVFEVIERVPLPQERLQKVSVRVTSHRAPMAVHYLLAEGERASVTVPMETTDDHSACLPLSGTPRLFLGFPLIGAESFSFPSVVNSFDFTPTENRDGVYLGQNEEDSTNLQNQAAIEEACELHVSLVRYASEARWSNIHTLVHIPPISDQTWLNADWLRGQLEELIRRIRTTPAVLCGEESKAPEDAMLPLARDDTGVESLWCLLNELEGYRQKLPKEHEAIGWRNAVESWALIGGHEARSFSEAIDGARLVQTIAEETKLDGPRGSLDKLRCMLVEDTCAVEWLNQLCAFLMDDGSGSLIHKHCVVLNQVGYLDTLPNLHRDSEVDAELKDIAQDLLGLGIRDRLRDERLTSLAEEVGKGDYGTKDLTGEIVARIQDLCAEDVLCDNFARASTRMLAWITAKQEWNHLIAFPAFSTGSKDGSRRLLRLRQQSEEDTDMPLAPVKAWPEELQEYSDLFPRDYILAEAFYKAIPDRDAWQALNEQRFVRTEVIVNRDGEVRRFLPDEPLPDGEHVTDRPVSMTDVVFLTKDRVGVMNRVRGSQDRARLFWRFLTDWLAERDSESLDLEKVSCTCGESHRFYRASWLVPLVENRWVPQGNDIRHRATAESIARLLRGSGWTPNLLRDALPTLKLLQAMRVPRLDLVREFVVDDEKSRAALDETMTSILVSTDGDLRHVHEFVEDLKADENLPSHLEERRRQRRMVHWNQELGYQVENLVREALSGQGFAVRRTGIGSDFEIEHDIIEEDEEIGIELSRNDRSWLVEVKATRGRRVRMSAKQAETAVAMSDGFLLCVVPVGSDDADLEGDEIHADMRFVRNLGTRLRPLCQELEALNELRDQVVTSSHGDVQLQVQAGSAGILVDDSVWQDGVRLARLSTVLI